MSWRRLAQAYDQGGVELQKDMVQRHWREFTICDAFWHVRDAWGKVMQSCICGAWKRLCPQFAVDFNGFNMAERDSEEWWKCLMLAKKVGLDNLEDDNINSLLSSVEEGIEELEQR